MVRQPPIRSTNLPALSDPNMQKSRRLGTDFEAPDPTLVSNVPESVVIYGSVALWAQHKARVINGSTSGWQSSSAGWRSLSRAVRDMPKSMKISSSNLSRVCYLQAFQSVEKNANIHTTLQRRTLARPPQSRASNGNALILAKYFSSPIVGLDIVFLIPSSVV